MGDPAMYPEIRSARNIYALQRLPRDFTDDVMARKQWVDNNLTYFDGLLLANFHYHDADFRRDSWPIALSPVVLRLWTIPVKAMNTLSKALTCAITAKSSCSAASAAPHYTINGLINRMITSIFDDLGRPASSAGVERMFSKAGRMHDDMKASQSDDTLEHSMMAAANAF
eukprot:scaffold5687_cov132-Isochrysis_galbana.AAC.2